MSKFQASVLVVVLCLWPLAAPAADRTAWELMPNRVQVVAIADESVGWNTEQVGEWLRKTNEALAELKGEAWRVELAVAPPTGRGEMLRRLDAAGDGPPPVPEWLPGKKPAADKVVLVAVDRHRDGLRVRAREYDALVQRWNASATGGAPTEEQLAATTAAVIREVLTPLARVEPVDKSSAILRLRGSHLPGEFTAARRLSVGQCFLPLVRPTASGSEPTVVLPWTVLGVTKVGHDEVTCEVLSGLDDPWRGHRARNFDRFALAVRPWRPSTELVLVSNDSPPQPLMGLLVRGLGQGPAAPPFTLRAGREGGVRVPSSPAVVETLWAGSDAAPCARLPLVPGVEPVAKGSLPATVVDLQADAWLASAKTDLVEFVARREVVMAMLKADIAAARWPEAEATLKRVREKWTAEAVREHVARRGSPPTAARAGFDKLLAEANEVLASPRAAEQVKQLADELDAGRTAKP